MNGANSSYEGIATSATLLNLSVLDSQGIGSVSNVLSALDWIMTNRTTYNIRVVNMSLGTPAVVSYLDDPLCKSVRRLVDAGIVVVAAAGNEGKTRMAISFTVRSTRRQEPSAITSVLPTLSERTDEATTQLPPTVHAARHAAIRLMLPGSSTTTI